MTDTYKVMENDTIESVASKYGTSPEIINFLNNNIKIQPGMIINVPRIQSDYFDYYVVRKGDTLYDIANSFKIEPSLLSKLNGINLDDYIYPNQVLLIPKPGSILYFTANGDTLSEVANGINANMEELLKQNKKIYLQPEQLIVYKYK